MHASGLAREPLAATDYGYFTSDGAEYVIVNPRTPRPWVNVIANPRVGVVVSHTGSGFSWIDNSQLAAIVRWQQDLATDVSGRFLYLRDDEDGTVWSLAPSPCWTWSRFECRHGLGYTKFRLEHHGIASEWTLFVDADRTVEVWRLRLVNTTARARRVTLVGFLEWNCGTSPAPRREFQKLFLETTYDERRRSVMAASHMWDVPSRRGHWNTSFPYVSAFTAAQPVSAATGDKSAFLGRFGRWEAPAALHSSVWPKHFGRHYDPVAALACPIALDASGVWDGGFTLATADSQEEAQALGAACGSPADMDRSFERVTTEWTRRLAGHRIRTPDQVLDVLTNDWLRYQAISARLWGRAGYYQQSGAFGYRDQLQDSQVWLTIESARCRDQIQLHAGHQFSDGSVVHWWHPLTEQGHVTRMTDDLLWLAFVTASYIKETGDLTVLDLQAPFLDHASPAPVSEHVLRAFDRVFQRTSARGLPYIGAGDWNDGLSAVGLDERGESIWLAMCLAGVLGDWAVIQRRAGADAIAVDFEQRRSDLIAVINAHAWDGAWYRRATRDDGEWIGSSANTHGRIYLNAQTWAVLNDVAPQDRASACMAAVRSHLLTDAGALLLAPAYEAPDDRIGYITRYGPGLRENGGVYTHAATWAIAAAAKMKDAELAATLLAAINPALKDPDRYHAEPYVLAGNVDGPSSPLAGRAGWTWYTGSAAWLARIVSEWILGVRPTWDGLRFDPCLPPSWGQASMVRPWRGAVLDVTITRRGDGGPVAVLVNGEPLPTTVMPTVNAGERYRVDVRF